MYPTSAELAFAASSGSKCSPVRSSRDPFFELRVTDVLIAEVSIRVGLQARGVKFVLMSRRSLAVIACCPAQPLPLPASSRKSPPPARSDGHLLFWRPHSSPARPSSSSYPPYLVVPTPSPRAARTSPRPSCTSRCPCDFSRISSGASTSPSTHAAPCPSL